jgi:DNA polymerase III epsilon subunit-like protein
MGTTLGDSLVVHKQNLEVLTKMSKQLDELIDKDGEDAEKVIKEFIDFVGKKRLVAYNVDFDRWFLQREISHWGIKKQFKDECAYALSRDAFDGLENYKLTTVARSLGIPTEGAHRALHDCIMTLWVYLVAKSKV